MWVIIVDEIVEIDIGWFDVNENTNFLVTMLRSDALSVHI